ncbi:hypothetical protein PbDSM24746_26320 [Paenibacillus macerans]|nr:hypothetical protein PbDSM24746_26320 [Paenibacillus macerans]GBK68940.1 hypothetical protein PbJCM17693_26480 [Paenibacillus macerans]GIP13249.1 hypothetical protein J1TS5_54190 [Paenibacillus macerans]
MVMPPKLLLISYYIIVEKFKTGNRFAAARYFSPQEIRAKMRVIPAGDIRSFDKNKVNL